MDLFGHEDSDEDDAFDDDEFAVGDEDGYDPSEAYDDDEEDARSSASGAPQRDLHPRFAELIHGHKDAEQSLLHAWRSGKLPSAYMFTGPLGIGKASMAYRLAAFLLEKGMQPAPCDDGGLFGDALPAAPITSLTINRESPCVRRMLAESHADLLVLEPQMNKKTQTMRSEIVVEQARKVGEFLSKTAGEGAVKIVIIDPIDALNTNAANAILKWLEEPPENSLFLLISHRPGSLLPTIRSRCRTLSFTPPDRGTFARILEELGIAPQPDVLHELYTLCSGSVGTAIGMVQRGAGAWMDRLYDVLKHAPSLPILEAMEVAELSALRGHNTPNFDDISLILSHTLSKIIRCSALGYALEETEATPQSTLTTHLAAQRPLAYWLSQWDALAPLLHDTQRLYLDKTQTMLRVIESFSGRRSLV